jgi:hypothetical protein
MIPKDKPRQKTVFATTPGEWDDMVNTAIDRLPEYRTLTIHREKTPDGFLAILEYTIPDDIPDDIREEMEMQGVKIRCMDCPHLVRVPDKRVKHLQCDLGMRELTRADMRACLWRYEQGVE